MRNIIKEQKKRKKISDSAFRLYVQRGKVEGFALNDWLEAENNTERQQWFKRLALIVIIPSGFIFWALFEKLQLSLSVVSVISVLISTLLFLGFNAFNRKPYNIQSSVIIAVAALLYTAVTIFFQGFEFELRNRPYIRVFDPALKLDPTGKYVNTTVGPEPQFDMLIKFINQGTIPGTITDVSIKAHQERRKVFSDEAIPLGPQRKDREWERVDIFPYLDNISDSMKPITRTFSLSLDHAKKLFGLEYINDKKTQDSSPQTFLRNPFVCYVVLQIKYDAFNEVNKKKSYWYWILYKYEKGVFSLLDSGCDPVIKPRS